jgi:hypothetical protein
MEGFAAFCSEQLCWCIGLLLRVRLCSDKLVLPNAVETLLIALG